MDKRMTQEELSEIWERAEKATEGPWVSVGEHGVVNDEEMVCLMGVTGNEDNDIDFIANAREDIPKLMAEVVRLRTIADELLYSSDLNINIIERYEKLIRGDSE